MFDPAKFVDKSVEELKTAIQGKAIIGMSGGVDSTVTAVLVDKAIGDALTAVYADTGYMRKNETEFLRNKLEELGLN